MSALEEEHGAPRHPLVEHHREIRERVARRRIGRVEAEKELAVDARHDPARRVDHHLVVGQERPRIEQVLELLGEVDARIDVDDLEADVLDRQTRPDRVAVERTGRRPHVRKRRGCGDDRDPFHRPATLAVTTRFRFKFCLDSVPVTGRLVAVASFACLVWSGCAQNPCDKAAQHEIDCKVTTVGTSSSSGGTLLGTDCSGVTECDSACIAKASCAELLNYADPKQSVALRNCLELCSTAGAEAAN